jgi:hypothetical protein
LLFSLVSLLSKFLLLCLIPKTTKKLVTLLLVVPPV